jgi:NADH-quinone oxidoreductase subunit N
MSDMVVALAPLLSLAAGGLALMMVDAFVKEKAELSVLSTVLLVVAGGVSAGLWVSGIPAGLPVELTSYLAIDRMSLAFDVMLCAGGALSALLAGGYLREHGLERGEFYVLLVFSVFGAMVLVRAVDLLTLFIGLETLSLGVYSMVGFRRTSPRAAEAALKYFLLGSFAAAILLFGAALLYGATGHTDFSGIGAAISSGLPSDRLTLALLAMALILAGLAFKVGAVPFHMWVPDAYEGAMTPATTFMSVAVKAAAFAVMVRVLFVAFGDELSLSASTGWPPIVAVLAAITMLYGNLAAIAQSSVKRMLAYSSIAHAGYALVGVVAAFKLGESALSAVFFYLGAYTVSNALAFGSLIALGSKGKEAVSYEDLAGAGRRHPLAALPFVVAVFSLMGMPPTAGFFGKYYVFSSAMAAGDFMIWLAVLGVLTSVLSAYYYLRVLVYLFMRNPQPGAPIAVPMRSFSVAAALAVSAYFVFKMGIAPSWYLARALEAAGTPGSPL